MKTSTVAHASRTVMAVLALLAVSTGCTRAPRGAPAESGFPADDSGLQKSADFPAALVYVKPDSMSARIVWSSGLSAGNVSETWT